MSSRAILVSLSLSLPGVAIAASGPPFEDVAEEVGLEFRHDNGMVGELYFVEMMGAGGAFFDYDGDGDLDVYLVQGGPLGVERRNMDAEDLPSDRLFRNDSHRDPEGRITDLRFTDVTASAGIDVATGYGMGVTIGDYDGDGDLDIYLTNFGPNQLLENDGEGGFVDVTEQSGTDDDRWSVPAVFLDHDADGDQDLFVGNYVAYDIAENRPCRSASGFRDYCSPLVFPPVSDRLFENDGAGRFENVAARTGLTSRFGAALGVLSADLDGDARLDLFVANDGSANQLWMRSDDGYVDEGALAGVSVNMDGGAEASMGVDAADFDADGDEDLFMTHLATETNTLYVNDGRGWFDDQTVNLGLAAPSLRFTGFGTGFLDYDADGVLDLFVANGAVTRIAEQVEAGEAHPLRQRNQLFRGLGDGRFEEVVDGAGPAFRVARVSRGSAFGDVDEDGDVDILVTNNRGPVELLLNRAGDGSEWLGITPRSEPGGSVMSGVRVGLHCRDRPDAWRTGRRTRSYASSSDPRILFALPQGSSAGCELEILWPDGSRRVLDAPTPGAYHEIHPESGRAAEAD